MVMTRSAQIDSESAQRLAIPAPVLTDERDSRAQLAESRGERADAAELYGDAAERWRKFGNVPERAYALLGQGRCLAGLGNPAAEQPIREARELFASMGYGHALVETEALLGEAEVEVS
jgi:hypothetical protein